MLCPIRVPQLGVNDRYAKLIKWYVKEKDKVKKGDVICCLETTKVSIDLEADHDGYVRLRAEEGERVPIQDVIGYIAETPHEAISDLKTEKEEFGATKKAVQLAKEKNIDLGKIKKRGIIKEKDVYEYFNTLGQVELK